MTKTPPVVVIGAGGLLGSNVLRVVPSAIAPPTPIPWRDDPTAALTELGDWIRRTADGGPWRVAWCAGSGVVGTGAPDFRAETRSLRCFLDSLRTVSAPGGSAFFFASSAGGVHAGTHDDPVTEHSQVAPMSAYGESKVEQEGIVGEWSAHSGVPVGIGRLSNLYGPGQNLAKPQGIISRLVRASLRSEPLLVFVTLDTVRDYLYAADAARRVGAFLDRVAGSDPSSNGVVVKLIASGRVTTIAELIAELKRIRTRRPPVLFGVTAATAMQPRALRFRSEVWPDLDRQPTVTLGEGIAAVVRDQLRSLAAGAPAPARI